MILFLPPIRGWVCVGEREGEGGVEGGWEFVSGGGGEEQGTRFGGKIGEGKRERVKEPMAKRNPPLKFNTQPKI